MSHLQVNIIHHEQFLTVIHYCEKKNKTTKSFLPAMDPFSITVEVVDRATSAYGSVKSLYDLISGLR
ncbi:hypothetical protein, partial [Staphylococcus aureus]